MPLTNYGLAGVGPAANHKHGLLYLGVLASWVSVHSWDMIRIQLVADAVFHDLLDRCFHDSLAELDGCKEKDHKSNHSPLHCLAGSNLRREVRRKKRSLFCLVEGNIAFFVVGGHVDSRVGAFHGLRSHFDEGRC